jgi:acyl transferase domain-containing protein
VNQEPARVVASMRHPKEAHPDAAFLQASLGRLWAVGVEVDFARLWQDEGRRRLPLPTYPFERKRFWVDPPTRTPGPEPETAAAPQASLVDAVPATPDSLLEGVIQQQLQLMQQQLALLGISPETAPGVAAAAAAHHAGTNGSPVARVENGTPIMFEPSLASTDLYDLNGKLPS